LPRRQVGEGQVRLRKRGRGKFYGTDRGPNEWWKREGPGGCKGFERGQNGVSFEKEGDQNDGVDLKIGSG